MKTFIFITIFLLAGCVPYMTHEEMEEAHEIAETKEERDALMKRILVFEANWEKAILYFEEKRECAALREYNWFCYNVYVTEERRIKNVDGLVRAYKREHLGCGCVNTKSMENAFRRRH